MDSVTIKGGEEIVYDLGDEAPIFNKIQIRGRLVFNDTKNTHLKAHEILVRGGQFFIGT
jgi:hypothetical protein